ncbi:DNA mismatch repair protein spel1 isoform X2 [Rhodnius prolixus]|uniref:DNA mismatch repair protein spel1 isoform X2 n=1 Tax=Rhodnius prolixus TaxID=13249 RepID=UPI003D18F3CD
MASKVFCSMDPAQQKQFVTFLNSLPQKPSTTVRFFSRTDYYSVHGEDAQFAAKEIFRSSSFVKSLGSGSDTLDYLCLNKSQFETFVRDLLLIKQYRVEVYTNKGKGPGSWILEFKGSPGNLSQFEEILFSNIDQVEGQSVLSVKYDTKDKTIGVALVEAVEHIFHVVEFTDDENFSVFEAILVQFSPKECIVPLDGIADSTKIVKIAERCNVLTSTRKKNEFSLENAVEDLNKLIKFKEGQQSNANVLPQISWVHAMAALAGAIKYLELCADSDNFGQFRMETLDHGRFVHLDVAAVNALSICSNNNCSNSKNSNRTLSSLLDRCRTSHGHRLLNQWIKQPLKDINLISERHDIVEVFLNETLLRQSLYEEHLRKMPDFQVLSKKVQRRKANMQDCYRIYQGIAKIPSLLSTLQEYRREGAHATLLAVIVEPLKDCLNDLEKYQEMILSTLDMTLVDRGEYLVKAEFDEDLQELRDKMEKIESKLKSEVNVTARDLSLDPNKTLKLESNSQYGYFFRVTLKDEKAIRNNKKYVQLDANKAGLRFQSIELTRLNDEYQAIKEEYSRHQQSVVEEVVSVAAGYCGTLHNMSSIIAQLDVLCSFAVVASCAPKPYVRPVMKPKGSGILNIIEARHPSLEVADNVSYIPNSVNFNKDKCTFYIITGPNMGGKSTYIRSIGIIALLAHIGSLVPCASAEISILDAILARVGANDSQIKGMSTFMVEMVETASILKMATSDSLVIIDELGRGTSTYEGFGIAFAIAEYLAKEAKSFCLFATHFHELTRLADEIPSLGNLHVTAVTSEKALTLLYEVKPGACDQSFGIQVASMARFPSDVIEDAKRKLAELEDFKSKIEGNDIKKRKIIQDGEVIIKDTLKESKQLALNSLDEVDFEKAVIELRKKLTKLDNPYIKALIQDKVTDAIGN